MAGKRRTQHRALLNFGGHVGRRQSMEPHRLAQRARCAICWGPLSQQWATEDHVVPAVWLRLHGARHGPGNRLATHPRCNSNRGSPLPTQDYLDLASAIAFIVHAEEQRSKGLLP